MDCHSHPSIAKITQSTVRKKRSQDVLGCFCYTTCGIPCTQMCHIMTRIQYVLCLMSITRDSHAVPGRCARQHRGQALMNECMERGWILVLTSLVGIRIPLLAHLNTIWGKVNTDCRHRRICKCWRWTIICVKVPNIINLEYDQDKWQRRLSGKYGLANCPLIRSSQE